MIVIAMDWTPRRDSDRFFELADGGDKGVCGILVPLYWRRQALVAVNCLQQRKMTGDNPDQRGSTAVSFESMWSEPRLGSYKNIGRKKNRQEDDDGGLGW